MAAAQRGGSRTRVRCKEGKQGCGWGLQPRFQCRGKAKSVRHDARRAEQSRSKRRGGAVHIEAHDHVGLSPLMQQAAFVAK